MSGRTFLIRAIDADQVVPDEHEWTQLQYLPQPLLEQLRDAVAGEIAERAAVA